MSENKITEKAKLYLASGQVKVVKHSAKEALIEVQGSDPQPYDVAFNGFWHCNCPARVDRCAHIVAAQLISPLRENNAHINLGSGQSDITEYLNRLINK